MQAFSVAWACAPSRDLWLWSAGWGLATLVFVSACSAQAPDDGGAATQDVVDDASSELDSAQDALGSTSDVPDSAQDAQTTGNDAAGSDQVDALEPPVDAPVGKPPPSCTGASTVGKPCQPAKNCLPGFKGRCGCFGCKCKPIKRFKTTCPGQSYCDCSEHWDCDFGLCVGSEQMSGKPWLHKKCAPTCIESCPVEGDVCTPMKDACGAQTAFCLPQGVTPGDVHFDAP